MLNNFCLHIEFYVLNQAFSEAEKPVKCFHPSPSVIELSIHTSLSCFSASTCMTGILPWI